VSDDAPATRRDALAERLYEAVLGYNDVVLVHLGERLGLYRALAELGTATPPELATAAGTDPRYTREWLEHQAVGGFLDVEDTTAEPDARRYGLPAGHEEVLVDRDDPSFMAAFARMTVGLASPVEALVRAFRTGEGVPYADYGEDFREGQGDMNRVAFVNSLASEWLPAIPDVQERLLADPPARVADVACGVGWSTLALARAYPKVRVDGIDLDEASIASAERNLAAAPEVSDRVTFAVRDAADLALAGAYDLVTIFEAVHDLSDPVGVLRAVRGLLAQEGTVLVADEAVAETFTAPGNEFERLAYAWSVLHCLPTSLVHQPSAATGTAMRPDTLRRYATDAGFAEVEVLPIENDFWRFYRLRP
jgi:2-polyprenyl-3-methyl-5-hydroxy-6-metoxy-1,4-benzoquinol methylase